MAKAHGFLATVGADDTARVWEVESGEEIALVNLPDRRFAGVNFSRDGLSLLLRSTSSVSLWRCYACGDEKALLAEVDGRKIMRQFTPHEERRFGVRNGPDTRQR